ncbi:hypothetical protein MKX03_033289 [Papaver bracteatum]|nr:hypothetical protein MKX03_033289 [Papaver bracteatum]
MTKHRDKDVNCHKSSVDDEFVKQKKKNKSEDSCKDGAKEGVSNQFYQVFRSPVSNRFRASNKF